MKGLQAQQSIGAMSELVYFPRPTYTQDGYGGILPVEDSASPVYYRAQVTEVSAKEAPTDTPQDKVIKLIEVVMRANTDIDQRNQLVWNGTTYDITDLRYTQRQRYMMISARFIDNDT